MYSMRRRSSSTSGKSKWSSSSKDMSSANRLYADCSSRSFLAISRALDVDRESLGSPEGDALVEGSSVEDVLALIDPEREISIKLCLR